MLYSVLLAVAWLHLICSHCVSAALLCMRRRTMFDCVIHLLVNIHNQAKYTKVVSVRFLSFIALLRLCLHCFNAFSWMRGRSWLLEVQFCMLFKFICVIASRSWMWSRLLVLSNCHIYRSTACITIVPDSSCLTWNVCKSLASTGPNDLWCCYCIVAHWLTWVERLTVWVSCSYKANGMTLATY